MDGPPPIGPTSPPAHVLDAFGATTAPVPLSGGHGRTWRAGGLVLKPLDVTIEDLEWQADVLPSIRCDGFRVSIPVRTSSGSLTSDGWSAWTYCKGHQEAGRWSKIIAVGERYHRALAGVARPSHLSARKDRWAIADRVAWDESSLQPYVEEPFVAILASRLETVDVPSQLIHGDLTGNVLFAPRLEPAVIDLSAYWRPPPFATAIVVADALAWEGADESLLDAVRHVDLFGQFLARALIFRIVSDVLASHADPPRAALIEAYRGPVAVALRLSRS